MPATVEVTADHAAPAVTAGKSSFTTSISVWAADYQVFLQLLDDHPNGRIDIGPAVNICSPFPPPHF
jgi:hypothetical protein